MRASSLNTIRIDQDASATQTRYLRATCRRVKQRLGGFPWVTKHLFGSRDFSISIGGDQVHRLRDVLASAQQLTLTKVFHKEGITYAYVQLRID
ncbi:hypothetical protein ACFPAF_21025 [Hymenobacter endophyticus]|uniref:Uncharacterized protein n=1 Tax=Hymenobacter endophyticus TaxID=3076335 RepID=A0ABU3TNF2_9BACT|nr:hypothetical protein [Hymenobacter endophyticus]MDU0372894.1 hypothetical protein [Hymenobacter endophyticus]